MFLIMTSFNAMYKLPPQLVSNCHLDLRIFFVENIISNVLKRAENIAEDVTESLFKHWNTHLQRSLFISLIHVISCDFLLTYAKPPLSIRESTPSQLLRRLIGGSQKILRHLVGRRMPWGGATLGLALDSHCNPDVAPRLTSGGYEDKVDVVTPINILFMEGGKCWSLMKIKLMLLPQLFMGGRILIPYEDKVDVITLINRLFIAGGEFWSLMKIKLMLLLQPTYCSWGWQILIPHGDIVDVISPINILFRGGGKF